MLISFKRISVLTAYGTLALAQFFAPASVQANPSIALNSAIYVEQAGTNNARSLAPANRLSRGDRVVTILTWYRMGGNGGFTVTNPVPRSIAYQASTRDDEEVSVDGGRTWGALENLQIGSRMATREDVTHVRWRVPANMAARGSGRITYSGIVR